MKFFNQMVWDGEAPDIGLDNSSVTLSEWAIQGGGLNGGGTIKPISEPDPEKNRLVAKHWACKSIIVLDIENLHKQLVERSHPHTSPSIIAEEEAVIRRGYYDRFRQVASQSEVFQYNTNNTAASDGVWLSIYATPNQSPDQFIDGVKHRLKKVQSGNDPVYLNTSPVIFQHDSSSVMPASDFESIMSQLMAMDFAGLCFWYRVAVADRLPVALALPIYEVLRRAIVSRQS